MSDALGNVDIAQRMKDYFRRQIDWFEQMRLELQRLENGLEGEEFEQVADQDRRRAQVSRALHDEFAALKKEWDRTGPIADTDREAVRAIARRAEEIGNDLQQVFDRVAHKAGTRAEALRNEFGRLRHNKGWMTKYRPTGQEGASFVDRKA